MANAEQRNQAKALLRKAEEYLASAEDNLAEGRNTVAAGDAIHAGICAKDAVVTALTGTTRKGKDHKAAAKELRTTLAGREQASTAANALRELVSAKVDVEYRTALTTPARAGSLVRRASTLVELAVTIVRLGA
jgi:HEPN domain-containing protein